MWIYKMQWHKSINCALQCDSFYFILLFLYHFLQIVLIFGVVVVAVIVVSLFNRFIYFHFNKLISTRKNLNIIALKRGDVLATKFDSKETARTIIECSQFVEHK